MKESWIELENTFLSDVPRVWLGKKIGFGPDPDAVPTIYCLAGYKCTRTKRGVNRRHWFETLHGRNADDLDTQLLKLTERGDVVLIEDQQRLEYLRYRGEPKRLPARERSMAEDYEEPREFFEKGNLIGPKDPSAYAKWRAERDKKIANPKRNEAALEFANRPKRRTVGKEEAK